MNVAIIPARGGSKRIPKKNIKNFRGKPIISWSIKAAIESNCFDHIIVSTDCEEIAKVAKIEGASVPYLRPKELSNDFATSREVVIHCIEWLKNQNFDVDYLCCLYATAPFVRSKDISNAFHKISTQDQEIFTFTATNFSFPIQRAIKINDQGRSSMFHPEEFNTRSQDLEKSYHDAGQFYIAKPNTWIENKNLFENAIPIVIPNWRVQDIDDPDDWKRAELLHEIISRISFN
tara:strand:- start:23 stop:721 length:699 start_codon:yes stop_codon:yes gene_type:complete